MGRRSKIKKKIDMEAATITEQTLLLTTLIADIKTKIRMILDTVAIKRVILMLTRIGTIVEVQAKEDRRMQALGTMLEMQGKPQEIVMTSGRNLMIALAQSNKIKSKIINLKEVEVPLLTSTLMNRISLLLRKQNTLANLLKVLIIS